MRMLFSFYSSLFSGFKEVLYTNMSQLIAMNPRVTALNSCIEVDLTGQVCSDSIGAKVYSGECLNSAEESSPKINVNEHERGVQIYSMHPQAIF